MGLGQHIIEHEELGIGTGTETDPIVGAVSGIVKADGAGNISVAVEGVDYLNTANIDGGLSNSTYLLSQVLDCGGA